MKDLNTLVIQKIECIRTASELDSFAAGTFNVLAKSFGLFVSKKPQEAGGVYSVTQEEWENQNEAVDSWTKGVKKLGNPGNSRDQLYIKLSGKKIWPTNKKHHDIKSGKTVSPNLSIPWQNKKNSLNFQLMEWDVFSDDSLGKFTIKKSEFDHSASKQIIRLVTSKEEGSMYKIHLKLKS